jgi:tetratricopeptide (TPR) repeat protein
MWLYSISLIIIIICLSVIAVIIFNKFSQLILINTEAIPKERDLARKRKIMEQRIQRIAQHWLKTIKQLTTPAIDRLRDFFRQQVKKLQFIDQQFRNEKISTPEQKKEVIEKLRQESSKLLEAKKFDEVEKKLIEILSLDELNEAAYLDLGEIYLQTRRWNLAKETYAFLAKLLVKKYCGLAVGETEGVPMPQLEACLTDCSASAAEHALIAKQFFNFGLVCLERGEYFAARSGFETAAVFEPANPKHLDFLVEACIMEGDKVKAGNAWEKLRAVNPENNKLIALRARIDDLPE